MSESSAGIYRREREALRERLASVNLDGPVSLSGDIFSKRAAVCTLCGALILLDDPMSSPADQEAQIERGVFLHTSWHAKAATPEPTS